MTKANLHYEHALRECSLIIAERGKQVNEYTEFLEGLKKFLAEKLSWLDSRNDLTDFGEGRQSAYKDVMKQIEKFQAEQR